MPIEYNGKLIPRAKEMRARMTSQEQRLWFGFLREYPVHIYRQRVIYQYIADFYCSKAKLVIEVDGSQHSLPDAVAYDRLRTLTLNQVALEVLRFTNAEVDNNFTYVCKTIDRAIKERMNAA